MGHPIIPIGQDEKNKDKSSKEPIVIYILMLIGYFVFALVIVFTINAVI